MKTIVNLTEKQRDELVVNILTDSIIFERIATAMNLIQTSADPKVEEWDPESQYSSYMNAYPLMGFPPTDNYDEEQRRLPITDVLWKIFHITIKDDDLRHHSAKLKARQLAETILNEWKTFLMTGQKFMHQVPGHDVL